MRFDGDFAELKSRLGPLEKVGEWREVNKNQYQFKSRSGGVLNWYPTTGSIQFQGRVQPAKELELLVANIFSSEDGPVDKTHKDATDDAMQSLSKEDGCTKFFFLDDSYSDSELVIGLVGTIGTDLKAVYNILEERLKAFSYKTQQIKISTDVISVLGNPPAASNEFERIDGFMVEGNLLRRDYKDNSILALGAAAKISQLRGKAPGRNLFVINSLKSPHEVQRLRKIYAGGFFLIGVHADHERRRSYLVKDLRLTEDQASNLISRDANEREEYGQHTRDTFHLSDFFVNYDGNIDSLKMQIWRVVDLLFGRPYVTPTFDEYAMFMAFSASLRSADLSRQVGAVLTKNDCIISTGANDVPKFGGGLYWPCVDGTFEIVDKADGRDYKRGEDSNAIQKRLIIDEIINSIPEQHREAVAPFVRDSRIKDITEYGRVVHAEMEALLSSSRSGISTIDSTLYCTTFPCHNCAKHIIASGVRRVVYVEPYPKSKAQEFHSDSISLSRSKEGVFFEPFIGVGPRSFFDLFSTNLGSGYPVVRKTEEGQVVDWSEANAKLRTQMLPCSYMEREDIAAALLSRYLEG